MAKRVSACQRRIEQGQPPAVAVIVVAADDACQQGRVVRHRPRKSEGGGKPGAAPVERKLAGAVRVHAHPPAREIMGDIAVFPTLVQDTAIVEDCRVVVAVLVEGQLAQRLGGRVEQVKVRYLLVPVQARQSGVVGRGTNHQLPVRQMAGVEEIHIGVVCRRHLLQPAAILAHLEDGPPLAVVDARKEQALAGEIQARIAENPAAARPVEPLQSWLSAQVGEDGDFIVPDFPRQGDVGQIVERHKPGVPPGYLPCALAGEIPAHHQQPVEIEQRIRQQHGAEAGQESFGCVGLGRSALRGRQERFAPALELPQDSPVRGPVVAARETAFHVFNSPPHGLQVDTLQRLQGGPGPRPLRAEPPPLGALLRAEPPEGGTVGKRGLRPQPQRGDVRERPVAPERNCVRATIEPQPALVFPLCRLRLPAPRHARKPRMHLLPVHVNLHRARLLRRVEAEERVVCGDRELDLILGPVRKLAAVPDAGRPVRIGLPRQAHLHVAVVKVLRLNDDVIRCRHAHCRKGKRGQQDPRPGKNVLQGLPFNGRMIVVSAHLSVQPPPLKVVE